MRKLCFFLLFLFCLFLWGFPRVIEGSIDKKLIIKPSELQESMKFDLLQRQEIEKEYLDIFFQFLTIPREPGEMSVYYRQVKKFTIDRYLVFLKRYWYNNHLHAEAKLRIAEFYEVIFERPKAKKWLDDIIINHLNDDYCKIKVYYNSAGDGYDHLSLVQTNEKTAAWALYYRAMWFPGKNNETRLVDLKRILSDYPDCGEAARLAAEKLKKELERRK